MIVEFDVFFYVLLVFYWLDVFIIINYFKLGDVVDFLRLIIDYESEVVVFMEFFINEKYVWVLY